MRRETEYGNSIRILPPAKVKPRGFRYDWLRYSDRQITFVNQDRRSGLRVSGRTETVLQRQSTRSPLRIA